MFLSIKRGFATTVGLLLLLAAGTAWGERVLMVEVDAGRHDREDVPVALELPEAEIGLARQGLSLAEIGGKAPRAVPAQLEAGPPARVHWVLAGKTPKWTARRYELRLGESAPAGSAEAKPAIELQDDAGRALEVRLGGKPVLRYNYGLVPPPRPDVPKIQTRNAYIHPIWTPSGRVVTNDYPSNHLHHRGLWFPHTKTEFEGREPDFWNLGGGKGKIEFVEILSRTSGPVYAGFQVKHRHIDLTAKPPKPALEETWEVRVYAVGGAQGGYHLFDLTSVQRAAGPSPLRCVQYRYGGLGYRGPDEWEGPVCYYLTSEGETRKAGHATRARWCDMSGPVGNRWAGVTFLCHPKNFRAPQNMRIHPNEPFFNWAPCQLGDFEIDRRPYVSRYRFVPHDGANTRAEAERFWVDYAEPPSTSILWVRNGVE